LTSRIEAELDRLILGQHVKDQSRAGVTLLRSVPSDNKCKKPTAETSKKKRRIKSQYV